MERQPLKLKLFLKQHGIKINALTRRGGLSYSYVRRVLAGEYPVTENFKAQVRHALPYLDVTDDLFESVDGDGGNNPSA